MRIKPSPTRNSWMAMRARCLRPKAWDYYRYGGRGIKVCKRWEKFENFLADMGERPENCTIDRIDVNGDYKPSNCKWATRKEQSANRADSKNLTYNGLTKSIRSWGEVFGISHTCIRYRLSQGWSVRDALETKSTRSIK